MRRRNAKPHTAPHAAEDNLRAIMGDHSNPRTMATGTIVAITSPRVYDHCEILAKAPARRFTAKDLADDFRIR